MNESGGSIVLSAINQWDTDNDGITLNNVGWGVILGNKTKIDGGDDVIALGNNMNVTRTVDTNNSANSNLIIFSNHAKANDAAKSVVIGKKCRVQRLKM